MDKLTELSYALDTFYLLISGAFVMWMAAGFAMLEAGLVRAKNTTEILTKNVVLYAIACIMYMLCGYNLMYPGEAVNSVWPGIEFLLSNIDNEAAEVISVNNDTDDDNNVVYSKMADFFFQVVFVATAMSIVSGAVCERMKLWAFLGFSVVMTGFIYPIQGYWKWGGGFLDTLGFFDFAGSGVVHLCGASAALAGVLLLGPRKGKYGENGVIYPIPGCNMPLATLGTLILWMGWFGFNGGSELIISNVSEANTVAKVFVNTNAAAAAGVVAALITAHMMFGKADLSMILNGALAGLVAITADPASPSTLLSTGIGFVAGGLVVVAIVTIDKLRIDDPVGAISVHGISGILGLLAVCLSNEESTLSAQLIGIATIFGFVFTASLAMWFLLKSTMGIRVSSEDEYQGVDFSECGMEAYPEFTSEGSK
ncbi:ammonium transporter [Methylicorpusculum oleiharenae]|uniref:ammonium transporter n=1 Tax=Methylicorpusculum oleiharenae TaxID=1338687 RepID=UPI00135859B4|nr:ammonium transporter [Methylicorpusculum oleiharenae]